ncbi:MAG: hypothetical protein LIP16_09110 [Clostridium sp.]|nr:hypothetical protein [Clostridium sp.]
MDWDGEGLHEMVREQGGGIGKEAAEARDGSGAAAPHEVDPKGGRPASGLRLRMSEISLIFSGE